MDDLDGKEARPDEREAQFEPYARQDRACRVR